MKVVLLSAGNSIHTARWANGLSSRGIQVLLLTAHPVSHPLDPRVEVHRLRWTAPTGYVLAAREVARAVSEFDPDLVNVHYATGYGLLARLAGLAAIRPLLLSVWGSDVYDFPNKSGVHRAVVAGNVRDATAIASTSESMARRLGELHHHRHVFITPFGIDTELFRPGAPMTRQNGRVVIGTVKTLADKYGIDILIRAFAIALNQLGDDPHISLEISGGGPDRAQLEALVGDLGIASRVDFHGFVPHSQVHARLRDLDIYLALSRGDESFGVAILEAAACGKPVIVSDADGPAEVTRHGETGFVIPKNDIDAAAEAMMALIRDPELRARMGMAGRAHVLQNYSWDRSLDLMLEAYEKTIKLGRSRT